MAAQNTDFGTCGKRTKRRTSKELDSARKSGFVRVRIDGNLYDLSEDIKLEKI